MTDELARLKRGLGRRYRLERQLGAGGMATVYLAVDLKHHRQVAIKVLRPELAAVLGAERFLREIEISARLHHPHMLPLYDSGEAAGLLYYVMPYIEGESLRLRLDREKQLPVEDALQIAREVADALSYAHGHNVVHRDIKPENILLESGHAVVADFGIARAVSAAGGEALTATGMVIGTPAYLSPEQAAGSKELDGRSDLYSLGCVLYEMLAGQPPFTGPTVESIVHQHLAVEPPNIASIRPAVPGWVTAALHRALAKTPADRFNPVALFGEALRSAPWQGPGDLPRHAALVSATPPIKAARTVRTRSYLRSGVAVLGLLLLAAGALSIIARSRAGPQEVPRRSIAVLPFADMTPGGQDEYFADGMTEEILSALTRVPGLKVAARTSAFAFKGKNEDIRIIGEKLGVTTVLEGSVRREARRVRIAAQLISVADGFHLWSDVYEREHSSIFAIQDEIARAVVAALELRLAGDQATPLAVVPTASLEAHDEYLRGRFHWAKRTEQGLRAAISHFERATALDSGYAFAYSGLADAYAVLPFWDPGVNPQQVLTKSQTAAERAITLAPTSPEARTSHGYALLMARWDLIEAERELRQAIHLNPGYATAHHWLADLLSYRGRLAEAMAAERRALDFDPLSVVSNVNLAALLRLDRQYVPSMIQFQKALDLDPVRAATWFDLALTLLLADSAEYASRSLERWAQLVGADTRLLARVPSLVSQHRRTRVPAPLPRQIDAVFQLGPMARARLHALVGDRERALELIERVFQEHWPHALEVAVDPIFESLRNDSRFSPLLRRIQ